MRTFFFEHGGSVVADDIRVDKVASVRRFLRHGEVVRTVPIDLRFGYSVVTEVMPSAR